MSRIGHNSGPPAVPLTAKTKLECIKQVLLRGDLTAAQKCVGTMMIVQADREWVSEIKTGDLTNAASVKDKETVFRATKRLDDLGIINKAMGRGQSGRYVILPPNIIGAVIEAYDEIKSGRAESAHSQEKWSGETGRHNWSAQPPEPVGTDRTTHPKVVGSNRTTQKQSVQTGPVSPDQPTRAEVSNIYNNINNLHTDTQTPPQSEQVAAREGEEHIGEGVFVNCETIRHKDFSISLKGIDLQLVGTVPMEEIKAVASGHALQWAIDIASGKRPRDVVPSNTASFIRGSIQNQRNRAAESEVRANRSSRGVPRKAGQSFSSLTDELLKEIEQEGRK